jgi:hypothetical protein
MQTSPSQKPHNPDIVKECLPMLCIEQTRLFVRVIDGAEVAPDNFKVGILADVVFGHLKHA